MPPNGPKIPKRDRGFNILINDNGFLQSIEDNEHPRFQFYSAKVAQKRSPIFGVNSFVKIYLPALGAVSYQVLSMHIVEKTLLKRYQTALF